MEARGLAERATEEARQLREATQSEVDATLAEVENTERQLLRLRGVQRELEASLQQSLAALAPVLSLAAEAAPRPAARVTPVAASAAAAAPVPLAPVPLAPVPPAVPCVRAAPVAPVPLAPVPLAPVPAATACLCPCRPSLSSPYLWRVRLWQPRSPCRRLKCKSAGALEIFPLEMAALRPFERRRNRPRVGPPPPASRVVDPVPQAGARRQGRCCRCRDRDRHRCVEHLGRSGTGTDQTDAAAMVPSATPAASSAANGATTAAIRGAA